MKTFSSKKPRENGTNPRAMGTNPRAEKSAGLNTVLTPSQKSDLPSPHSLTNRITTNDKPKTQSPQVSAEIINKNRDLKMEVAKRIVKGIEYFWKLKPSELSYLQKHYWTTFLQLLRAYFMNELNIYAAMKERENIVKAAETIFESKAK